ncbi:MAG: 6-phospho-beta-glucosidase [Bacteroidales bacterium]|nr:6-phospho-beta-glucosidase [Bacteroidales bacterium]
MKIIENNNKAFSNIWEFVEEYLPNYSSRDDVFQEDILFRYLDEDYVCDDDLQWIHNEFGGDKKLVKEELVKIDAAFLKESIKAYYDRNFS